MNKAHGGGLFYCLIDVGFFVFRLFGFGFRPRGELLSFTRVKESNQRKHAPTKPLFLIPRAFS